MITEKGTYDRFEVGLKLTAVASSVARARDLVRGALKAWELGDLIDDAELIMSELVTNAVKAVEGEEIWAKVGIDGDGLVIRVWDPAPDRPFKKAAENDDESGRGMTIVDCVAADWGSTRIPGGGKIVWARVERSW